MQKTVYKDKILLEGERLTLQPLREADLTDEYVEGLNDPRVNRYLAFIEHQTEATVRNYVKLNWECANSILFGIFLKNESHPFVGTVRVSDINWQHWLANVGVGLFAQRAWKKGYAQEAVALTVDYCFKELGLHYLEAGAYAENVNSVTLFQRVGFKEVYRIKNKYAHDSCFKEVIYLAIENEAFDESVLARK